MLVLVVSAPGCERGLRRSHGGGWRSPPPSARRGPWQAGESLDGSCHNIALALNPKANLKDRRCFGGKAKKLHIAQHGVTMARPGSAMTLVSPSGGQASVARVGHADPLAGEAIAGCPSAVGAQHGVRAIRMGGGLRRHRVGGGGGDRRRWTGGRWRGGRGQGWGDCRNASWPLRRCGDG